MSTVTIQKLETEVTKKVDATVGYQDPQCGQKFIFMINQAVCIDGLVNHLWCPMQCYLNGVHISEVPMFLAETTSETTHAIELVDPFDAAHWLIIWLQLSSVTSYFDVYSPSITEYENEDFPKTQLTADKPPWDPPTCDYSEREYQMLDHQGQFIIPVTMARGPVFVSTVVSCSVAYDDDNVMDNDNLVNTLEAQIQISAVLIGTVR